MGLVSTSMDKKPNLFSAISIGVSSIVGSGWLFASYKTAQYTGPIAILSWIIGAALAFLIALLLAEIATIFHKETGLFARLITITHNRDYGFIVSLSNWLAMVVSIPGEAEATLQYLAMAFPKISYLIFANDHFTKLGTLFVFVILFGYGILNYWGIKLLTRANNVITIIKLVVPALTAIIIFAAAFHPQNFTSFHGTIAPYGYGRALTAVVTCGIFYSFYGFSMITIFAKELKNPQRNIPLALGGSVILCLIIYMMLQVSFIGAIDPNIIATKGWHSLYFSSPLAQLAVLLGINWLSLVLYVDAAVSPSGTAIVYLGSGTRMFSGMAEDKQMPKIFSHVHPVHKISRLALLLSLGVCMVLVVCFDNWSKIMIVVSVFQLIACVAVPIAFIKLRLDNDPQLFKDRTFKMPCGFLCSYLAYLAITYLLTQSGSLPLITSFLFHALFFLVYCSVYYKKPHLTIKALLSSLSMFTYLLMIAIFGYLHELNKMRDPLFILVFITIASINFYFLIQQKSYHNKAITV